MTSPQTPVIAGGANDNDASIASAGGLPISTGSTSQNSNRRGLVEVAWLQTSNLIICSATDRQIAN